MRTTAFCTWVVMATSGLFACNRDPTADDAREYYGRHQKTIDAIDADMRAKLAKIPWFGKIRPECTGGVPLKELNACGDRRVEFLEERVKGMRQFERDALAYLERPNVIGIQLMYTSSEGGGTQFLADVGLTPGGTHGRYVPSEKGVSIGERRVGYGQLQTSYRRGGGKQYGDGTRRPGIEVGWTFAIGGAALKAKVWVLADHDPPPGWSEGFRRAGESR